MLFRSTRENDKWEVTRLLQEAGLPAGPVLDTLELSNNESLRARGMIKTWDDPVDGPFEMAGCPIKLSASPVELQHAPALGADNAEIYNALGLSEHQLKDLKSEGIL